MRPGDDSLRASAKPLKPAWLDRAIDDQEALFYAETRGGRYAIVVFQSPIDKNSGTYTARTFTNKHADGGMSNYQAAQMRERIRTLIRDAAEVDGIRYKVLYDAFLVYKDEFAGLGAVASRSDEEIRIEWGTVRNADGWLPVIWINGRQSGHTYGRGLDLDEAELQAQAHALEESARYIGDWKVSVAPR